MLTYLLPNFIRFCGVRVNKRFMAGIEIGDSWLAGNNDASRRQIWFYPLVQHNKIWLLGIVEYAETFSLNKAFRQNDVLGAVAA